MFNRLIHVYMYICMYRLEFNAERKNWQVKSAANRGLDSAFAYIGETLSLLIYLITFYP